MSSVTQSTDKRARQSDLLSHLINQYCGIGKIVIAVKLLCANELQLHVRKVTQPLSKEQAEVQQY